MKTKFLSNRCNCILRVFIIALIAFSTGPVTPARADTSVCGPITTDTTWGTAGNNYMVTCLVQVMPNVTLTIEPGVRVYFNAETNLRVDGELIAREVTFNSSAASPAPGNWGRIFFMSTSTDAVFDDNGHYVSGSLIQDSTISYGGGGFEGALMTYGASPYFVGNTILGSASRGIYATSRSASQPIFLKDNFVSSNNGGGIYVSSGQVLHNTIQGNAGRGIYALDSILAQNTVADNTGGGIYTEGSQITGNTVTGNSAQTNGGGIYATGGTIEDNEVTGNSLGPINWEFVCGGGIYASAATITGNTVDGNRVSGGFFNPTTAGAGICAYLSTLTENTITNNSASVATNNAYGGGIYSEGSNISQNTVSGNSVSGNTNGLGGGIYAKGGSVSDNTINDNVASGGTDSQGGGVYGDISTIQRNTLVGNSANLGGAIYANQGMVRGNTIESNTSSLTGAVYMNQGSAIENEIRGNTAANGGGLYGNQATLTGNTLEENTATLGGGIQSMGSTVRGNTVTGNTGLSDGGGIYAEGGEVIGNTITGNSVPAYGHGSGAYLIDVTNFSENLVQNNTAPGGTAGGVSISGQPALQYNNLYGNTPYDAELVSSEPVTATLNYWGASQCLAIPTQIFDGHDAPGRGVLNYAPSLYLPVPVGQLPAPANLTLDVGETNLTLAWEAIPDLPDVGCRAPGSGAPDIGYRIFYGNEACAPFDGTGLPQGASPIDVGAQTHFTLPILPGPATFFAIAAYDYLGRQSHYSNAVSSSGGFNSIFLPLLER